MNTDTKRHIDSARQVLVGVVPNPASQIDQITNALIYKFMDDMDQAAIKAGGVPSFFIGDLEIYAWTRLMDSRMGNQERMNLYQEALMKLSESKQLPELFRGIFKSAFLPYRSPETLGLFLKEIDYFDYSHPEELGNAYEYLLSIMSSQGDAGQFRTPRHIIDFIVDVVNPTKDDKVLDPACGTGGFLVSSYKHILEQHDGKNDPEKKEKPLSPDDRRNLMNNFEGYDIDPGMVRIAQVNMYLHQFKSPKIFQYDSLSNDERWNDKFDVILANPPFMSPKGGIKPHSKFSIQSSRSEVLFVDYIMNHLRPGGRAGIIVPEGIIFQSGTAYKQLRKNLVEDGLFCVVSLPQGVFNPYAGVKTSILLFNNEIAKKSANILFVKIQNDGFDLGSQRKIKLGNELPMAIEAINGYKKYIIESNETENIPSIPEVDTNPLCQLILKERIVENGDYNLSGDRYRATVDYTNAKWPMVELGEVCEFVNKGGRPASFASEDGKIPFIVSSFTTKRCNSADYDTEALVIGDGGSANIHYVKGRFSASDHTYILKNKDIRKASLKYLYHLIFNNLEIIEKGFQGQGLKNVSKRHLQSVKVPLPDIEVQEKIVAELDGYQDIITGVQLVSTSWKPKIEIDPEWKKVKLGDICKVQGELVRDINPTLTYIGADSIEKDTGILFQKKTALEQGTSGPVYRFKGEKLLYSKIRPYLNKLCLINFEGYCSSDMYPLEFDKSVLNKFAFYYMLSESFNDSIRRFYERASIPKINRDQLFSVLFPLPSLEIQGQIIEKIEAEYVLIKSTNKLREIYEQKIKNTVAKIWGE